VEEHKPSESQSYLVIKEQFWYKLLPYELVNLSIKISLYRYMTISRQSRVHTGMHQSRYVTMCEVSIHNASRKGVRERDRIRVRERERVCVRESESDRERERERKREENRV